MSSAELKKPIVKEVFGLFRIMKKYNTLCGLTVTRKKPQNPFFITPDAPIDIYGENSSCITVELGETDYLFVIEKSQFSHCIVDNRIFIVIYDEDLSAFFGSKTLPLQAIEEANLVTVETYTTPL